MPWPENDDWPDEPSCELCMRIGHTLASCPQRDDDDGLDQYEAEEEQRLQEQDLPPEPMFQAVGLIFWGGDEPAVDAHLESAYEDRFISDTDL